MVHKAVSYGIYHPRYLIVMANNSTSGRLDTLEEEIVRLLKENNRILKINTTLLENINENVRRIKTNTS